MHGHAALHPHADGGDLVLPEGPPDPHAAAPFDPVAVDAVAAEHLDQHVLQPADVGHDVDRFGEPHDRIAHQLTGPVPRDLAAPVDVDDGRAVGRALVPRGAGAGGVDRVVLEEKQGVGAGSGDDLGVDAALERPPVEVGDIVGGEAHRLDREHRAPSLMAIDGLRPTLCH
nr:hypothetical protein GCM10025699_30070 [Microbacterium flavescens]